MLISIFLSTCFLEALLGGFRIPFCVQSNSVPIASTLESNQEIKSPSMKSNYTSIF